MTFDPDSAIKAHLDCWLRLLDLDRRWSVTYELTDDPIAHGAAVAENIYVKKRDGKNTSRMRFHRPSVLNDRRAEEAVIHEVIHILDHGMKSHEQFVERLERPLRLARKRASR